MKKKLLLVLMLATLLTGCGNNNTNSSAPSINTSVSENSTSTNQGPVLPDIAKEFIEAVNAIRFDENVDYAINKAYYLYDLIDDYTWAYFPEVQEAYYKLVMLEETYYDYVRANNMAEDFISKVNAIPYFLTLEDERYIIAAETAYEKLDNFNIIGIAEAYERLLKYREQFDLMFMESLNEALEKEITAFLEVISKLPSVENLTLYDLDLINNAEKAYEYLSYSAREDDRVIESLTLITQLKEKYKELQNNPDNAENVAINAFISSVNSFENVSIDDGPTLFRSKDLYQNLSNESKYLDNVKKAYEELNDLLDEFFSLYTDANGAKDDNYDGFISIETVEDLLNVKNNLSGNYVLKKDIDLKGIEWENLGNFTGVFDGNGHTLRNVSCTSGPDAEFALFLEVKSKAVVKNLVLEGWVENAGSWAGAIAVRNYGTISNCLINLDITSRTSNGHIGGIVCENEATGLLENCIVLSKIQGSTYDGGICVGQYGKVTNCYFLGSNVSNGKAVGNSDALNECKKSAVALKTASTYSSFDKKIWCIIDGFYPMLIMY